MNKGNEKSGWDKLSLREKAQYFQQAIAQGITDKKEIVEMFNTQFNEQLDENLDNTFANGGLLDNLKKLVAPTYKTDSFGEAFSQARADGKQYFKWNGNRYNTQTEVEQWREAHPEINTPEFAITDAVSRIQAVENNKNNKSGGYDTATNRWYPHKSVEGGNDTVGFGFKLGMNPEVDALINTQGYLTDEQNTSLTTGMVQKYMDSAKNYYNKKYGEGSWDNLSPKTQSLLTDYHYNPGLSKFPKFVDAIYNNDLEGMYDNYKRYSGKRELGRNKYIKEELDKIKGGYFTIKK